MSPTIAWRPTAITSVSEWGERGQSPLTKISPSILVARIFLLVAITTGLRDVSAAQTKAVQTGIKTDFIETAELSEAEVTVVTSLAKECGLGNPQEIATFYCLPSTMRAIHVKSAERIDGRNISYDTVYMNRVDWCSQEPCGDPKRLGQFWVGKPYMSTRIFRKFELDGQSVRIAIGKNLDAAFVDKVITQIAAKKVRFKNSSHSAVHPGKLIAHYDSLRSDFERLDLTKARAIDRNSSNDGYEMSLVGPVMKRLMFRVNKGVILITGVATVCI